MGDYFRYLVTVDCDLTLAALEELFRRSSDQFSIHGEEASPNAGDLLYGSSILGDIEINRPGEEVFDEDLDEQREILDSIEEGTEYVRSVLERVKLMVALQLTEEGHGAYDQIDPLWDLLFENCDGLLQVDDEGFYDSEGVVLALD
ncbi:MAG: hypothetical protein IPK19_31085 [Chloroflexi bacterium]|nr:hypothetical protein [Chloroflexota bacterium]